ncbi:hypothetical protein PIB30_050313 [Stylosanthes scabra]|uniref:Uncharacterized protein n=1 Tax=Stylosanthes scabra TaxID=79078 RepID=A0ABU6RHQ0_9FABA|nr:hypothetical protein [Stylosanthes scabra]
MRVLSWSLGIQVVGFEMQQAQSTTSKGRKVIFEISPLPVRNDYKSPLPRDQKINACKTDSETEEHRGHEALMFPFHGAFMEYSRSFMEERIGNVVT